MNIEQFVEYCLRKKFVEESFPFGPENLVLKVKGKIFAITDLESAEFKVNLKCDPEYAEQLRAQHEFIQPGYHMNKKHWNTVHFDGDLSDSLLKSLIDHSYDLIVQSLPKKDRF
ncbi:MAG TPA: MmcQ/YjbR family DNA-binding protein [Saprospiraceae bacterium]|nr:MmcQ/YjbR family DNA-binding protein [Saprospiraceae bacterium]